MSDAAKILELESQIRERDARLERIFANYDRVSTKLAEVEAKPNSTREMIAEFEVARKAFRRKPYDGENYPGAHRRHGMQDALAAVLHAAVREVGLDEGHRIFEPLNALSVMLANVDVGFLDPTGDPKQYFNGVKKDGSKKGRARKDLRDQQDHGLIVFGVRLFVIAGDASELTSVPMRDGTSRYRAPAVRYNDTRVSFGPGTYSELEGRGEGREAKMRAEMKQAKMTTTPFGERITDKNLSAQLGPMAEGGTKDKTTEGGKKAEAMRQTLQALGITGDEGVKLWTKIDRMGKDINKWPPHQRRRLAELIWSLKERIRQEAAKPGGLSPKEVMRRVYEDYLGHIKKHGGFHRDHGARALSMLLKARHGLAKPRNLLNAENMLKAKDMAEAIAKREDPLKLKAAGELKAIITDEMVKEAPDKVDITRPITAEQLNNFPNWQLDDFTPDNLVLATKARAASDRRDAAIKRLKKRHVKKRIDEHEAETEELDRT